MKILLAGACDQGGGSYWLADAINRYTQHEARAVRGAQSYIAYPYDVLAPGKGEMDLLIKWADVVHIRENIPKSTIGVDNKALVVTYTGRLFRKENQAIFKMVRRGAVICYSTPDMGAFCKALNPIWLPNPREDLRGMWKPTRNKFAVQAPTSRSAKHTEVVIRGAQRANLPLDILEHLSYAACLKRKAQCRVTIDQIKYGYGNNAIEAWALGMPVLSGFSTAYARFYRASMLEQVGGELPFVEIVATPESVAEALACLRLDRRYYKHWCEVGREHFFRYHHAPIVAKKAIEVYEQALAKRGK